MNSQDGVADDGEVLEVALGLLHEPLSLRAGDRRKRPFAHRVGTLAEAGDHRVDVELVGHRAQPAARPRKSSIRSFARFASSIGNAVKACTQSGYTASSASFP